MSRVNIKRKGVTLTEVLIASSVTLMMGCAILYSVVYSLRYRMMEQERTAVVNAASKKMEDLKKVLFHKLTPSTETMKIDVRYTPTKADDDIDVTCNVTLKDLEGNIISQPSGNRAIKVEIGMSWESFKMRRYETLVTYLTP